MAHAPAILSRLTFFVVVAALPFLLGADSQDTPAAARLQSLPPVLHFPPDGWTTDSLTPTLRWEAQGHVHLWIAPAGSTTPVVNVQLPVGTSSYTLAAPLTPGQEYRWKVRANPFDPQTSYFTWSVWSAEYAFKTPGDLPWHLSAFVRPISPANGTLTAGVAPTLTWLAPPGATHYQLVITQAGQSQPIIRFVDRISDSYTIPAPPQWFGMLPGTTYQWSVRVNNAPGPVPDNHPSWGPWSEVYSFRTPVPPSSLLGPAYPPHGAVVSTVTPRLQWGDPTPGVFLYEVQVSRDPSFETDPAKASAPVYWETVHGGMTTPPNSYQVPDRYPLQRGSTYYWRVRPAMPAGVPPAPWGATWTFTVQ